MSALPRWHAAGLTPGAVGLSASRRTDIPALYAPWLRQRLVEGFAEYVPLGPPRRVRRSLRPEDVTHVNLWTKWPRPCRGLIDELVAAGWPVLLNVTITGLGGTPVEPHVPAPARAVAAVREAARIVTPAAILWRYDPVFLSARYDAAHHHATFARLAGELAGSVDRVAISFPVHYRRQVAPDLRAYERETGDAVSAPCPAAQRELGAALAELARGAGIPLVACCAVELQQGLGLPPAGCNSFAWARRVCFDLERHRTLRTRPCREGCSCSEEHDIGVYDTCTLGCRYSYGSRDEATARRNAARHDPAAPCLIP